MDWNYGTIIVIDTTRPWTYGYPHFDDITTMMNTIMIANPLTWIWISSNLNGRNSWKNRKKSSHGDPPRKMLQPNPKIRRGFGTVISLWPGPVWMPNGITRHDDCSMTSFGNISYHPYYEIQCRRRIMMTTMKNVMRHYGMNAINYSTMRYRNSWQPIKKKKKNKEVPTNHRMTPRRHHRRG